MCEVWVKLDFVRQRWHGEKTVGAEENYQFNKASVKQSQNIGDKWGFELASLSWNMNYKDEKRPLVIVLSEWEMYILYCCLKNVHRGNGTHLNKFS